MKFETDWMTLACDFHNKKCCTIIKVRENAINISHFSSLGCSLKFLSINLDYHVRVSLKFRITWNVNHVNHRNCQSRSTDFSEMCQRNVSANSAKNENGKDSKNMRRKRATQVPVESDISNRSNIKNSSGNSNGRSIKMLWTSANEWNMKWNKSFIVNFLI